MSCQLLLVDDEPNVSKSIRRALRSQGYDIHIASCGSEALELLKHQSIDVILSDHRMPGMTGAELLRQVTEKYPSTVNIMLSGQADMEAVVDAVNDGNIFKFLHKPWSNDALRETVAEAANIAKSKAQANDSAVLSEDQFVELVQANEILDKASLVLIELRNASELRSHPEYSEFMNVLIARLSRLSDEYLGDTVVPLQVLEGNLLAAVLCEFDELSADNFFYALSNSDAAPGNLCPAIALGYSTLLKDTKLSMNQALNALTSASVGQAAKYSVSVGERTQLLQTLNSDMPAALENGQFYLSFQPQVSCDTEEILGAECLCRWNHPTEGSVSPEIFIDLAEQTGFINQLGLWIVQQGCSSLTKLQETGLTKLRLSINVSPQQFFQRGWVDSVLEFINAQPLSAQFIELEITESSTMEDAGQALEIISELRSHGLRIAMDDFGTGHSSLGQINQLPIDVLKLDRSLIMNIEHSSKSKALLRNTLSLAKDLGLETIAEGVETAAQAELCKQYGCTLIQGYYYYRPLSFAQLTRLKNFSDC